MTGTVRAATRVARVRKARKSSVLGCGHYVLPGQLIVNRGHGWTCLDCALAGIRSRKAPVTGPGNEAGR